jgi:hypothetical protein
MINLFRFSQVRTLQREGFKLVDALRLAYKDIYYTQYRKNQFLFETLDFILKGIIIFIPFSWVFFL